MKAFLHHPVLESQAYREILQVALMLCLLRAQAWGCVAQAEYMAKQKQAEQETQEGIDSLSLEAAKPAGNTGVLQGQGRASSTVQHGKCLYKVSLLLFATPCVACRGHLKTWALQLKPD